MECWDVLEDFLVGRKVGKGGGRGDQGLAVEWDCSPLHLQPLHSPVPLLRLLRAPLPCASHQEHLAQAEPGQLLSWPNVCPQLVFCSEKGSGWWEKQQELLTSHNSPSLLSFRQDHGSLPSGSLWSSDWDGGQQKAVMGQVWDTESCCWREECLAVVLDGMSGVS